MSEHDRVPSDEVPEGEEPLRRRGDLPMEQRVKKTYNRGILTGVAALAGLIEVTRLIDSAPWPAKAEFKHLQDKVEKLEKTQEALSALPYELRSLNAKIDELKTKVDALLPPVKPRLDD